MSVENAVAHEVFMGLIPDRALVLVLVACKATRLNAWAKHSTGGAS